MKAMMTRDISRGVSVVMYNPSGLPPQIRMGDNMRAVLTCH